MSVVWRGGLPRLQVHVYTHLQHPPVTYTAPMQREAKVSSELETAAYDSQAMSKLVYVLLPLVLVGAVYQLLYTSHKRFVVNTPVFLANKSV